MCARRREEKINLKILNEKVELKSRRSQGNTKDENRRPLNAWHIEWIVSNVRVISAPALDLPKYVMSSLSSTTQNHLVLTYTIIGSRASHKNNKKRNVSNNPRLVFVTSM